ncbi:MAG TPA: DUF2079 domain-containing protein [Vicinamibacteria bacterium]|nr:DUF2079 domain-containing protein [Vicinamibacteria bacterium]
MRGKIPLMLLAGFAIAGVPLYLAYATLQLEWHDHGSIYVKLQNVFTNGLQAKVHFAPFLYLLAALVQPFNSLLFFLALHVTALVLGAYALFLITRDCTASDSTAALLFFAFLANPYAVAANLYTHYDIFMVPALLFFYLFMSRERLPEAVACLVLALTIKEDVWLYASILILSRARRMSRKRLALLLGITAGYAVFATGWLFPHLYPQREDAFALLYTQGATKWEVLRYLVTHPLSTGVKLVSGPGLAFLSSLLFLPLFAPLRSLSALPVFYLWLNSTSPARNSLAFYYSIPSLILFAPVLPKALLNLRSVLLKLVAGRPVAMTFVDRWSLPLAAGLLLLTGVVRNVALPDGLERSPSLQSVLADEGRFGKGYHEHHRVGWDILTNRIPGGRSVITHFTLGTYVAPAHETYLFFRDGKDFESGKLQPDYVLYDLKSRYPLLGPRRMEEIHDWMLTNRQYLLVYSKDGYFLYRRTS